MLTTAHFASQSNILRKLALSRLGFSEEKSSLRGSKLLQDKSQEPTGSDCPVFQTYTAEKAIYPASSFLYFLIDSFNLHLFLQILLNDFRIKGLTRAPVCINRLYFLFNFGNFILSDLIYRIHNGSSFRAAL